MLYFDLSEALIISYNHFPVKFIIYINNFKCLSTPVVCNFHPQIDYPDAGLTRPSVRNTAIGMNLEQPIHSGNMDSQTSTRGRFLSEGTAEGVSL